MSSHGPSTVFTLIMRSMHTSTQDKNGSYHLPPLSGDDRPARMISVQKVDNEQTPKDDGEDTMTATESRPKGEVNHKTLSAYYKRICSLETYFHTSLSRPADPLVFTDLLSGTLCASRDVKIRPLPFLGGIKGSQQEALDRITGELSGRGKNILLMTERNPDFTIDLILPGRNASCAVFFSLPWRILRSRVGDQAFKHLMVNTSIFTPVGNNSFVQISGCPIYELYADRPKSEQKTKRQRGSQSSRRTKRSKVEAVQGSTSLPRRIEGPADIVVARQKMFYATPTRTRNGRLAAGLPPNHILNQTKAPPGSRPADTQYSVLLYNVSGERGTQAFQKETRRTRLLAVMKELVTRHNSIPYGKLLLICVERARDHTAVGLQPLSHSQVCRYVTTVLRKLLSPSIMGSEHNINVVLHQARRLVKAKQFEPINLHSLLQGLRISDFDWITQSGTRTSQAESKTRRAFVESLILWLFNEYLVPLLRNSFYITETAETRYETVYYPHEDWESATKPHFAQLAKDHLDPLDMNEKAEAIRGPLGVSAVRLIPKPNGFRPIVNLGRRLIVSSNGTVARGAVKAISANQALSGLHQVLTFEKERNHDFMGSALFGTNEIFAPLNNLKQELIQLHDEVPRLYFVKMDIKAAFDTIKQDKVLEVVQGLMDTDYDYLLMLYCLVIPPASEASQGSSRRLFKTRAILDDGQGSFQTMAQQVAEPLRNAVIVDMMRRKNISRMECLDLLDQHIKHNVWRVDGQMYRQREGIPQGSKISSLLCSIFYSALEKQHLGFFSKPGSRLLRYIDDFLYITDDYAAAKRFISIMSSGFPEYGAFISAAKTLTSFEYARNGSVAPVYVSTADGGTGFPFCGFVIDTTTLEITMDTPRMITGHMEQSFALRFARHRGKAFVGWFSRQLENRNHIAYLDTTHNSLETVHRTIFINFATTAMKIPHYFGKGEDISPRFARIIFESICLSVGYTHIAGRARVRHASRKEEHPGRHYSVRKVDFEFLGKTAILRVLTQKAGRFKDVVHLLSSDLAKSEYRHMTARHEKNITWGWDQVKSARF